MVFDLDLLKNGFQFGSFVNETGIPITFPSQVTLAQNIPIYGWLLSVDVRIIGSVNALNSIVIGQMNTSSGMTSAILEIQFNQLKEIGAIRPFGIEPSVVSINDTIPMYSVSISPPYPIPVDTLTLSTGEGTLYNFTDIYGGFDYSKFSLKVLDSVFNASVAATTNIFKSNLTSSFYPAILKIYASFNTAGTLSVIRSVNGVSVTEQLGSLSANVIYIFEIIIDYGETINLQYSVAATALKLSVYEVDVVN